MLFLTHKQHQVQTGELAARTFEDYHRTCETLLDNLGRTTPVLHLTPEMLLGYRRKLAETRGAVSLGNEVNRVRVLFASPSRMG